MMYNYIMFYYFIHLCILYLIIKCLINPIHHSEYPEHFYELGKFLYNKDISKKN